MNAATVRAGESLERGEAPERRKKYLKCRTFSSSSLFGTRKQEETCSKQVILKSIGAFLLISIVVGVTVAVTVKVAGPRTARSPAIPTAVRMALELPNGQGGLFLRDKRNEKQPIRCSMQTSIEGTDTLRIEEHKGDGFEYTYNQQDTQAVIKEVLVAGNAALPSCPPDDVLLRANTTCMKYHAALQRRVKELAEQNLGATEGCERKAANVDEIDSVELIADHGDGSGVWHLGAGWHVRTDEEGSVIAFVAGDESGNTFEAFARVVSVTELTAAEAGGAFPGCSLDKGDGRNRRELSSSSYSTESNSKDNEEDKASEVDGADELVAFAEEMIFGLGDSGPLRQRRRALLSQRRRRELFGGWISDQGKKLIDWGASQADKLKNGAQLAADRVFDAAKGSFGEAQMQTYAMLTGTNYCGVTSSHPDSMQCPGKEASSDGFLKFPFEFSGRTFQVKRRYDEQADRACRRHDYAQRTSSVTQFIERVSCDADKALLDAAGGNWAVEAVYGRNGLASTWGCINKRETNVWVRVPKLRWNYWLRRWSWVRVYTMKRSSVEYTSYGERRYDGKLHEYGYRKPNKRCEGDLPGLV